MTEPGSDRNAPARVPASHRLRGLRYASFFLLGVAVVVGVYWAYQGIASQAAEASCKNNLKKVGAALHAYHDRHGSFPPAYVKGKDGKPAHSWRVLLLPFLDRQDLYDAYNFDEPWDSPNNLRLADQMPDVFACPSGAGRGNGKTSYVAVVGSQTVWPGDRAVSFQDIEDGTSRTALLIEIADSDIAWTEPRDVRMDEIIPPDGEDVGARFASGHTGIVNILMCDGFVRSFKTSPEISNARQVIYTVLTARGGKPFKGEWLPGENPVTPVADFPAERDADSFRSTDVLPHPADPIRADRNYIYCATFQLAWDDFRRLVGGDPQVAGRPLIAAGLNGPALPRSSLSPASYVARMGLVSERVRDRIITEMGEKFPGVSPSLSEAGGPNDFVAYAYLQKNLPFEVRFDRVSEPLVFHSAAGDTKITSFGVKELASASSNVAKLKDQVEVLHYESDDEFVLRFRPKTDEIVLAKIRPLATLGETLRAVQEMIGTPPKKVDRPRLEDKDKLLIPRLGFNVLRRYSELIGKHLENPGKEAWRIAEAKQAVRFLLNESGARLESEVELGGYLNGHTTPPPPPRKFVFDRPFLIYLKERTAEQPYLAIWVANAELMERRD